VRQNHLDQCGDVGIDHWLAGHAHPVEQGSDHDVDEEQDPVLRLAERVLEREPAYVWTGVTVQSDNVALILSPPNGGSPQTQLRSTQARNSLNASSLGSLCTVREPPEE
jgi:hypothetical protein